MGHEMFLAEDFYCKERNVYETITIISKRSRQIGEDQRREMDAYLSQVEMMEKFQEEDEGLIEEAPEPHEPVLQFEKPTILSLREMIADKLDVIEPETEAKSEDDSEGEPVTPFPTTLKLEEEEGDFSNEGI